MVIVVGVAVGFGSVVDLGFKIFRQFQFLDRTFLIAVISNTRHINIRLCPAFTVRQQLGDTFLVIGRLILIGREGLFDEDFQHFRTHTVIVIHRLKCGGIAVFIPFRCNFAGVLPILVEGHFLGREDVIEVGSRRTVIHKSQIGGRGDRDRNRFICIRVGAGCCRGRCLERIHLDRTGRRNMSRIIDVENRHIGDRRHSRQFRIKIRQLAAGIGRDAVTAGIDFFYRKGVLVPDGIVV